MPNVKKIDYIRSNRSSNASSFTYYYAPMLFAAGSLFTKVISSPLPSVAPYTPYSGPSSIKLYSDQQTYNVRVVAAACAATSMVTSFTVFYWFYRMEKRFRHRLIMLLIFGDLMKAMWLFLQAIVSIARGTIVTKSAFCQFSGFFVQFGTEQSDYAVLCIAVHSALQVFRPSDTTHSDGLYSYRYCLYVGALLFPATMAALVFANPRLGYMSQGPYCSLPLKPRWYRLALQWVPRYLISIIILGLAVAIYAHVGFEFRAMSNSLKDDKPSISTLTHILSAESPEIGVTTSPEVSQCQVSQFRRGSLVASMIGASRRPSGVASVDSHTNPVNDTARASSIQESPHAVNHSYMLPQLQTYDSANTANASSVANRKEAPLDSSKHSSHRNASPFSDASQHLQRQIALKRSRIHRQLRLMFIYPIVYILVWLFPFISYCLTFKEKYAARPVYWLTFSHIICITSMGAIDCLIFSLRERPWSHIPSSDGSFLGSFTWWRTFLPANGALLPARARPSELLHRSNTEANPETPYTQPEYEGWKDTVMRAGKNVGTHSRNSGGSSDRAKAQAVMARMRLELENKDRRVASIALDCGEESSRMPKGRRGTAGTASTVLETVEDPEEKNVELGAQQEGERDGDAGAQQEEAETRRAGRVGEVMR